MHLQRIAIGLLACGCWLTATAQDAARPGQPAAQGHAGHGGGRPAKVLVLENADGARITYWKPDLTTLELGVRHGHLTLPPTGLDNYHALVVEQDWGAEKVTLIRYEYSFGKPSGHSPAELAAAVKTELEVVPDPIPREHYRYLADRDWDFLVRYRGEPLPGAPVTLTSSHGSRLEATSDEAGRVTFRLPDDWPEVVPGRQNNDPAELAVSSRFEADGHRYATTLTAPYYADPGHWQSLPMGAGIAALGFLAGGLLGRVRRTGKER